MEAKTTPNGIKAIFFDFDGTLRHSVPTGGDVFNDYVLTLGLQINDEDRLRALRWEHQYWANSVDLRDDLLAHSADTENFWIEYSRRRLVVLGASPEWAVDFAPKVSLHMGEVYQPESIVPDEVRETLAELKQAGYQMAVISNRAQPFQTELDEHRISEFFAFSLAGGEVGSYKPEARIFEHALLRGNVTPQETLYIGDNYFADVVGSRSAGLRPVLYDPEGVFPEADCPTIKTFDELKSLLHASGLRADNDM
ncbi:MAG TPA: HAD family hydrolase [Anaerolineales bacterium]|nr:HAD family hydrolase [Anaerolineales bacterium]